MADSTSHDGSPKFRLEGKNEKKMYLFYLPKNINWPQNGIFAIIELSILIKHNTKASASI